MKVFKDNLNPTTASRLLSMDSIKHYTVNPYHIIVSPSIGDSIRKTKDKVVKCLIHRRVQVGPTNRITIEISRLSNARIYFRSYNGKLILSNK